MKPDLFPQGLTFGAPAPRRCKLPHLYSLIGKQDNTYEVWFTNEKMKDGSLEEHWDFLAPEEIKDPEAKKPEHWEDKAMIDNPEDSKPED